MGGEWSKLLVQLAYVGWFAVYGGSNNSIALLNIPNMGTVISIDMFSVSLRQYWLRPTAPTFPEDRSAHIGNYRLSRLQEGTLPAMLKNHYLSENQRWRLSETVGICRKSCVCCWHYFSFMMTHGVHHDWDDMKPGLIIISRWLCTYTSFLHVAEIT